MKKIYESPTLEIVSLEGVELMSIKSSNFVNVNEFWDTPWDL